MVQEARSLVTQGARQVDIQPFHAEQKHANSQNASFGQVEELGRQFGHGNNIKQEKERGGGEVRAVRHQSVSRAGKEEEGNGGDRGRQPEGDQRPNEEADFAPTQLQKSEPSN